MGTAIDRTAIIKIKRMKWTSRFNNVKTFFVSAGRIFRKVKITFKSADAKTVGLAGDFVSNHFLPLPLSRIANDIWRIQLRLVPGCYCYQFIVDGVLIDDPHACCNDPRQFGRLGCALLVK